MISKLAVAEVIEHCFEFQKKYAEEQDIENSSLFRLITQVKGATNDRLCTDIESPSVNRKMESSSGMILVPSSLEGRRTKVGLDDQDFKKMASEGVVFQGRKRKSVLLYAVIVLFVVSYILFNFLTGVLSEQQHQKDI